jgi:NADH:ubiquinone oxidoreductase subunit H
MAEFWTSTLWPLMVMIAQSVLLLVVLLIVIAYILLADRKIWAAVQLRRGPNVVGPWGLHSKSRLSAFEKEFSSELPGDSYQPN